MESKLTASQEATARAAAKIKKAWTEWERGLGKVGSDPYDRFLCDDKEISRMQASIRELERL